MLMVAKDHSYLLIPVTNLKHLSRTTSISPQRRMSFKGLFQVVNCQGSILIRHM
jgi:hypothetical protein